LNRNGVNGTFLSDRDASNEKQYKAFEPKNTWPMCERIQRAAVRAVAWIRDCDSRSHIRGLEGLVGREVMIDKIPLMGYTMCRAGGFRDSGQSLGSGGSGGAFKSVLSGGTARVAQVARRRGLEASGLMAWRAEDMVAPATRGSPF
jgi:hypothetical protein